MSQIMNYYFGGLKGYTLADQGSGVSVSILPEFGAMINEFVLQKDGNLHALVEGLTTLKVTNEDEDLLISTERFFRSSKLSPFPNRIYKGQYSFMGVNYQLPVNFKHEGNSIHGLVYTKPFRVENIFCNADKAELNLSLDFVGQQQIYPFPYRLEVDYILSGNKLQCITGITNTGTKEMPIGDGWHPYFRLGKTINDLILQLPECYEVLVDGDQMPTGKLAGFKSFEKPEKISSRHFDTCFKIKNRSSASELFLGNPQNGLGLKVVLEYGYSYFQLYTHPSRSSIAIEPMSCPANAFNNLTDLIVLAPADKIQLSWSAEVQCQESLLNQKKMR
jgi:aldose 1-epimerase